MFGLEYISIISVVIASVVAVAIRSVWYSPIIFGKLWMDAIEKDYSTSLFAKKRVYITTAASLLLFCCFFYGIAIALDVLRGMQIQSGHILMFGGVISVLFTAQLLIWERDSFILFVIHAVYSALSTVLGMLIMMYWPW